MQNKKKKFYISDKGDLIDFINIEIYKDLPTVFGNGENFYSLYQNLQNIRFPLETIKSFYFFDSGRWDLVMYDGKLVKLPIKNYLSSNLSSPLYRSKEISSFENIIMLDGDMTYPFSEINKLI